MAPLQAEVVDLIEGRFRRVLQDAADRREQLDALRRARPLRLLQAASNPDLLNQSDGYFSATPNRRRREHPHAASLPVSAS